MHRTALPPAPWRQAMSKRLTRPPIAGAIPISWTPEQALAGFERSASTSTPPPPEP